MSITAQPNSPHRRQASRATVVADMSMSLDGFVADSGDGVERAKPEGTAIARRYLR